MGCLLADRSSSLSASARVLQSRVFRGLVLCVEGDLHGRDLIGIVHAQVCAFREVLRSGPLVARCQGL
jgi:hypothetical protein